MKYLFALASFCLVGCGVNSSSSSTSVVDSVSLLTEVIPFVSTRPDLRNTTVDRTVINNQPLHVYADTSATDVQAVSYCITTNSYVPRKSDCTSVASNLTIALQTSGGMPPRYFYLWGLSPAGVFSFPLPILQNSDSTLEIKPLCTPKAYKDADIVNGLNSNLSVVCIMTNYGEITLALDRAKAPISSENFLNYVNRGYYADTVFHRIRQNSLIQGGGYIYDYVKYFVQKSPTYSPINLEKTTASGLSNTKLSIAMARTSDVNSATGQFYINMTDNSSSFDTTATNDGYAVFGQVVDDATNSFVVSNAQNSNNFTLSKINNFPVVTSNLISNELSQPDISPSWAIPKILWTHQIK